MFSLFCCRAPRTFSPSSREDVRPRTVQVASVESMALPSFNKPSCNESHKINGAEDAQALRDIFTAPSPTSIDSKAPTCGNLGLAKNSPLKPASNKLVTLGNAVKQRLSETRLSKENSSLNLKPKLNADLPEDQVVGGASYKSTGLTDLLMSRTASEGGYDSDAKDIPTPETKTASRKASPSTSSEYLTRVVLSLESSPTKTDGILKLKGSPSPDLKNIRCTDTIEHGRETKPSISPPRRLSSLRPESSPPHQSAHDIETTQADPAGEDFARHAVTGCPKKIGVSDAERDQTYFYSRSSSQPLTEQSSVHLGDMHISQRLASASLIPMNSPSSTNVDLGIDYDATAELPTHPTHYAVTDAQGDLGDKICPWHRTQPLAAHLPMSGSNTLTITSSDAELPKRKSRLPSDIELPWHSSRPLSATERFPGYIAQEHNRKPSDPKTRRLFERPKDAGKLYPKWKSFTSASSISSSDGPQDTKRDDGSSDYVGEGGLPDTDAARFPETGHVEMIKNLNSMAMPGRRASAASSQSCPSVGKLSIAREAAWLRDSRDSKFYSREGSENALAFEGESFGLSRINGEHPSLSRESRFKEEVEADQGHPDPRRFISSTEANEFMSEIGDTVLAERMHERMSDIGPDLQVRGGSGHTERNATRKDNDAWLSQGRRSGWNYEFIERSPSHRSHSRHCSNAADRQRCESAADVWDRAFRQAAAEDNSAVTSKAISMLNVPLWGKPYGRKTSGSSISDNQTPKGRGPNSVASDQRRSHSDTDSRQFSLDDHQALCSQARKPLPSFESGWIVKEGDNNQGYRATSVDLKDKGYKSASVDLRPTRKSLLDIRRLAFVGFNGNDTNASATTKEFLSWTKFPSHTRAARCGPAGKNDGVQVKDFSSPNSNDAEPTVYPSPSVLGCKSASGMRSPSPTLWGLRTLGRKRNKSKSMTFPKGSAALTWKTSKRGSLWNWMTLYRSQSSDLRRLRAGHRSSVTLGRETAYPELEIPAGLGEIVFHGLVTPKSPPRTSTDHTRITEATSEEKDRKDRSTEFWLNRMNVCTEQESDDTSLAENGQRPMSPTLTRKPHVSTGLDGNACSKTERERDSDIMKSGSNLSSVYDGKQREGDTTNGSFVSITRSNGFSSGEWSLRGHVMRPLCSENADEGVKGEKRLSSTELRDSTIDFKGKLMEMEKKSKDELLRLTRDLGDEE